MYVNLLLPQNLRDLQSQASGAFVGFYNTSNNFLKAVERGTNNTDIISLIESRSSMADDLLELCQRVTSARKEFLEEGGQIAILQKEVERYGEELRPLISAIFFLEDQINSAVRKTGIRITNHKVS